MRLAALADRHRGDVTDGCFCAIAQREGYPLYEMDLLTYGEEFYAAIKRSTNGGGENSPKLDGQDDYYDMFLAELRNMN